VRVRRDGDGARGVEEEARIRQDAPSIAEKDEKGDGPGQRRCRSKPVKGSFLLVPSRCRFEGDLKTSVMSLFLGWIFVRITYFHVFRLSDVRTAPTAPMVAFEGSPNDLTKSLRDRDRGATNWPPWKIMCIGTEIYWPQIGLCVAREEEWTRQPPQVEESSCQVWFW
jgi:hypothetical protein